MLHAQSAIDLRRNPGDQAVDVELVEERELETACAFTQRLRVGAMECDRRWMLQRGQLHCDLDAVESRHVEVENGDVHLHCVGDPYGLGAVADRHDGRDAVDVSQERRVTGAERFVVVDDKHARASGAARSKALASRCWNSKHLHRTVPTAGPRANRLTTPFLVRSSVRRGVNANGVARRWRLCLDDATLAVTERRKMTSSIICGVDGSTASERALAVAAQLADRLDLRLVLAHVLDHAYSPYAAVGPLGAGVMTRPVAMVNVEAYEEAGEQLLTRLAEEAGLAQAERRVASGFPAERLADLADEEKAEMIVVGSRGRGAFKAAFLGSVSSSLIGIARCPVLVVPPGA